MMAAGKIAALGAPRDLKATFQADTMDDIFLAIARGANTPSL